MTAWLELCAPYMATFAGQGDTALDAVNERYGRGALLLAIAGLACDLRVWA